MEQQRTEGDRLAISIVPLAIACTLVAPASAQSVVAFDCETNPFIPFPATTYCGLRDGLDLNDGGCLVFADGNGVYVTTVSGGKAACAFPGAASKRGQNVGKDSGGNPYVLNSPRSLQRINENGCVAFRADVSPLELECRLAPLGCDGVAPPCQGAIAEFEAVVRGRASGPADCARKLLFLGGNANNPSKVLDLDILETKAAIPGQFPPTSFEYRAIAALENGDGLLNRISFLGPNALQQAQYVDAVEGGHAPDSSTYLDDFTSVTEGDVVPVSFSAMTDDGSTRTVVSELHVSMTACGALFGGNAVHSRIDLGCVECFGTNDSTVVHFVDDANCVGAGGIPLLAESEMSSGSPPYAETRILLAPGVYRTLDCGELLGFGTDAVDPIRVSASLTPAIPPRCGVCSTGCSEAAGIAVFKGTWRPAGSGETRKAIFVATAPRRVHVLVQEGDPLPWPHSDKVFVEFGDPRVNAAGMAVFWAQSDAIGCNLGCSGAANCGGVLAYDLATFLAGVDPYWDLDGDGDVGTTDLLLLLGPLWGTSGPCGDFDGDGLVGTSDMLDLKAHWGTCP